MRTVRINNADLRIARQYIERAGVADWLEARLRTTQAAPGGAPRQLTVKGLLTLLFALARFGHKMHLERAYEAVWGNLDHLDTRQLRKLGLVDDAGRAVSYGQIHWLYQRIAATLDPSPHQFCMINGKIRNPRLTPDDQHEELETMGGRHRCVEATETGLTDAQQALLEENREALQQFLDEFLDASLPTDRGAHNGAYAIDASSIAAWSRGRKTPRASTDPDAGWSVKKADGATVVVGDEERPLPDDGSKPRKASKKKGRGGTTKVGRRYETAEYGYDMHSFTWIRDEHGPDVPNVTERIVVFGGGRSQVRQVVEVAEQLHAAGRPVLDVVVDRWYTMKAADNFHLPLRRIGADITMDYHIDQRGMRGTYKGALIIDGQLYSPSLPESLREIEAPFFKNMPERRRIAKLIAERQRYALSGRGGRLGVDTFRLGCPARRGQLRCALAPESVRPPADATAEQRRRMLTRPTTLPTLIPSPADAPPVCTQATIQVPEHVLAREAQKHPYLSEDWWRSYDRRPHAEASFGILKNPGVTDVHKGAFQVRGLAKTSLLLVMWVAAANIVALDSFEREHTPITPRRGGKDAAEWHHYSSRSQRRRLRREQGISVISDLVRDGP